jgi:AGZA family xanthine/uracil permease-like MFS transporter
MWVFMGWYAGVRVGYGSFRLPEALQVILVGAALGWMTGLNTGEAVKEAATLVKWWGPDWSAKELFEDFGMVKDYLGIVIPIGISATATTLMCLVSAKNAGDPFPVRETMIVDGIGTAIASFFGSPFGTVVYIGHPAYKRSGALVGYSLSNGMVYLFLSWFGILALVQSIVNQATIGPIVLFVGLMVNEEALNFMPARHYSAYVIGLFPSIYDWVVNVSNMSPIQDFATGGNSNLTGLPQWFGVLAWKRGALLVSFVWVAMLVMVIDRRWRTAGIWALVAAFLACCGIIHVPEAGFENFSQPTWEQCESYPDNCWPFAEQWMFFVSYLMLFATFALIELSRKYKFDPSLLPPLMDETTHAFNDWFADAAIEVHMHTHSPTEEVDAPIIEKSSQMKPDLQMEPDHHVKVVDDPDSTHQTGKTYVSNGKDDSSLGDNVVIIPGDDEEFGA